MEDGFDEVPDIAPDDAMDGSGGGDGSKGSGRGRGRGRGGGKAAAKSKAKADKSCFVGGCDQKCRSHSKFCVAHHKDAEALRYQAKAKNDKEIMEAVESALSDPHKAKLSLEEFAQANPEGRFRKKLVDWSSFMQIHGKRTEVRERNQEEQMDVTDYVNYKMGRGLSEQEALNDWKRLLETDVEREGEGAETKVWVVRNKMRLKDNVRYKDHQFQEGSRQVKDMAEADKQHLLDHVRRQGDSFADGWLRRSRQDEAMSTGSQSQPATPVPSEVSLASSGNKVELAIAAPKALEKNEKIIVNCKNMVNLAKTALTEALVIAEKDKSDDQLQLAYEKNCVVRLHMLHIWESESVAEVPAQHALPSGKTPPTEATPKATPPVSGPLQAGASTEAPAPDQGDAETKTDAGSTTSNAPAKMTAQLKKSIEAAGSNAQRITSMGHLCAKVHMEEILQSIMTVDSIDKLNQAVQSLKDAATMVKQLKDGAVKAANSLKSHIQGRQRTKARKRAQETKQEEQSEVQRKKKQAKEAAEEIKKQEATLPPLFAIDWAAKNADGRVLGKAVSVTTGPGKGSITNLDSPHCISNCTFLAEFLKIAKVQLMLTSFGGSYKKNPNMKTVGKCQELVVKNNGLDECQEMWQSVAALFSPSFLQPADDMEGYLKNVLKATWLYGLDAGGNYISHMPNGLGSLRFQCSGEVAWILFELKQLIPAVKILLKKDDVGGLDGLNKFMQALTSAELEALEGHGCVAHHCRQAEGQVMYVPVGWVAAERSVKGVLVYGIRKVVMLTSNVAYENYSLLQGLFEASGKPVDKMKTTSSFLQPAEPE